MYTSDSIHPNQIVFPSFPPVPLPWGRTELTGTHGWVLGTFQWSLPDSLSSTLSVHSLTHFCGFRRLYNYWPPPTASAVSAALIVPAWTTTLALAGPSAPRASSAMHTPARPPSRSQPIGSQSSAPPSSCSDYVPGHRHSYCWGASELKASSPLS